MAFFNSDDGNFHVFLLLRRKPEDLGHQLFGEGQDQGAGAEGAAEEGAGRAGEDEEGGRGEGRDAEGQEERKGGAAEFEAPGAENSEDERVSVFQRFD